jgi:peroxiredoxin/outer membrane lipoprotein-sorting protein
MTKLFPIVFFMSLAAEDARAVLQKMAEAYSALDAVAIEAEREESVRAGAGGGTSVVETHLALKGPEKVRVLSKSGENERLLVSNGQSTWRALPKQKVWAVEKVAAVSLDDDDAESNGVPRDLLGSAKVQLLQRYPLIAKMAIDPAIVKEESVKVGGKKVDCYVIKTLVNKDRNELWIDKASHFVVQHKQQGSVKTTLGATEISVTTKLKAFKLNSDVGDSLFAFEAPAKWKEAEKLDFPGEARLLAVGSRASAFSLKSLEGEPVSLDAFAGKVVVLDFWATWCPPCREEMPHLDKLYKELAPRGLQLLSISTEDKGTLSGFIKKHKYSMPVLIDDKRDVTRKYGIRAFPTLYILDRQGVVRESLVGSRSESTLRKAMVALLEK